MASVRTSSFTCVQYHSVRADRATNRAPLPSQPSLLDHLGAWPARIVIMVLLGAAARTALWLPWARRRVVERESAGWLMGAEQDAEEGGGCAEVHGDDRAER